MGVGSQGRSDAQLSLHDEAHLLSRLAERQQRLVAEVLQEAALTRHVSAENARLASDLAGSVDRIRELHHRIRNHLQTVTGLLCAQEVAERSPVARRALHESVERLTSIAVIHDLLARDPASGVLRLPELTQQLAHHLLRHANAEHRVQVRTDVRALVMGTKQATAFVLTLAELVSNALEHAFLPDQRGEIQIRVTEEEGSAVLEVRDNGRGLPPGFDLQNTNRLGLELVSRLAERDLHGSLTACNEGGAVFRVTFRVEGSDPEAER